MRRLGVFVTLVVGPMIFGSFGLITLYVVRVVGPACEFRLSPIKQQAQ
jgi:hypothetical protein